MAMQVKFGAAIVARIRAVTETEASYRASHAVAGFVQIVLPTLSFVFLNPLLKDTRDFLPLKPADKNLMHALMFKAFTVYHPS